MKRGQRLCHYRSFPFRFRMQEGSPDEEGTETLRVASALQFAQVTQEGSPDEEGTETD